MLGAEAGIGERVVGRGVVRIVGAMFPDPNFAPSAVRDMRFGVQSYALSFSAWKIFLNLVDYERPEPPPTADLSISAITTASKVSGTNARITATIVNLGTADAPASTARFLLDGTTILGAVSTPSIPAGGSVQVSVLWNTKDVKGEHTITVVADHDALVEELDEGNNSATLRVTVKSNKVTNGAFALTGT